MGQLGDKKFLIRSIDEQLAAINEQFEVIKNHDSRIPRIEIDIIKSNVREIYEFLCSLENCNMKVSDQSLQVKEPEKETPLADESKAEEIIPEKPEMIAPPSKKTPEKPVAEKKPEPTEKTSEPVAETKKKSMPAEPVKKEEAPPKTATPAVKVEAPLKDVEKEARDDLFSKSGSIIAERLMQSKDASVVNKITATPIQDLKKAIGINEKFLFINELF